MLKNRIATSFNENLMFLHAICRWKRNQQKHNRTKRCKRKMISQRMRSHIITSANHINNMEFTSTMTIALCLLQNEHHQCSMFGYRYFRLLFLFLLVCANTIHRGDFLGKCAI